ncbi:GntR family transcriptional regulator [Nocardia sp. NBC_01327]|uniref:GntR family transcriptional regulator n=1 Tax=Nocardia sp. NBC_01327 TaxID=2903593 RepID=UPI002E14ECB1|nr:GntR family transcriptional regulator [Nocardia sp. NBC_01327]
MNARAAGATSDLRHQVYTQLRERLMSGDLPLRGRLVETRVAEMLGASRTPVREALVRLHAEGLLTSDEGGWYPVIPDLATIRDLYEVRITLELRGIQRVMDSPRLGYDLDAIRALHADWSEYRAAPPEPGPDVLLLDEAFHLRLSEAAGNPSLTRILATVNSQIRLVRAYDYGTEERVTATIAEHLGILDAILEDELGRARTLLHEHVGNSYEVVEAAAARAVAAHFLGTQAGQLDWQEFAK